MHHVAGDVKQYFGICRFLSRFRERVKDKHMGPPSAAFPELPGGRSPSLGCTLDATIAHMTQTAKWLKSFTIDTIDTYARRTSRNVSVHKPLISLPIDT